MLKGRKELKVGKVSKVLKVAKEFKVELVHRVVRVSKVLLELKVQMTDCPAINHSL